MTDASEMYTTEDVAKHNSAGDLWIIVSGKVYDVTGWLPDHPGGARPLLSNAGKDATAQFNMLHNAGTLEQWAGRVPCVGVVANTHPLADQPADTTKPFSAVDGEAPLYEAGEGHEQLFSGLRRSYDWGAYTEGYMHLAAYLAVWMICYSFLYELANPWHLLFAIPFGWATYCLWMVGHESYHYTMAPGASCLNEILGYLCVDCLVTSRETWYYTHHKVHHGTPWGDEPQDRQRLFGPCVLTETAHLLFTISLYWLWDVQSLVCQPRLRKFVSLVVRWTWMLTLPLNALVAYVFSQSMCANYFTNLAHAVPVRTATDDAVLQQMRTAIDIFPHSSAALFVSGAVSSHCVHHVFPSLPRSLHQSGSDKLRSFMPEEYRVVDHWTQLLALWVLRDKTFEDPVLMKDLEAKAKGHYCKKFLLDSLSVAILCVIVACLPAVRVCDYIAIRDVVAWAQLSLPAWLGWQLDSECPVHLQ